MDLLARREHSATELRQKLILRDFEKDEIDFVLEALQRDNLQSDSRFTESYIRHRVNAGLGPKKIEHELRTRGINAEYATDCLCLYEACWDANMEQQRIRKFGEKIPSDHAQKMKQARFLQNRGFSAESVMRLFR